MTEIQSEEVRDNPLAFVALVYPWGEKGTPLEKEKGPRIWQRDELLRIRDFVGEQKERLRRGDPYLVYQSATASGRGVGKSAVVSWLTHWMLSTRLGSTVLVSANSESQLKYKTWGELGVWHAMAINSHWFDKSAERVTPVTWLKESLKRDFQIDSTLYYANASLWTEEKPDSFAGLHNQKGEMVIFDEASGIPASIWGVTEGYFSDPIPDRFWFAFSNPRRNQGTFFDCFHAHKEHWYTRNLDSREVEGTDKHYLDGLVKKHGEDSDEARVEVKGQFPRTGDNQFISRDVVEEAIKRDVEGLHDSDAPLIMGVDPARFGSDCSSIRFRQGRVARRGYVPEPESHSGMDNMQLADRCAYLIEKYNPDAVCIDGGNGAGIIDRLRQRGFKVHEVLFGSSPEDKVVYANKRTEIWGKMRDWLLTGAIDGDSKLKADLVAPAYKYLGQGDRLMLESKDDMKKRGLKSPDDGDALAVTFAVTVAHRSLRTARNKKGRVASGMDYDIFSYNR